jgi:hypothetical protein
MTIFHDQDLFMRRMEQRPDAALYWDLVKEETFEASVGWQRFCANPSTETLAETVDGAIDSIYVLAGFLNALIGPDKALQCWQEVQRSNLSKAGPDGVKYRDDGKILKPASYSRPNIASILANKL